MYAKDQVTILDRREQLNIKINSLAEEARMIRKAEKRTHGVLREELHLHRVRNVRIESRAATLAMGFIKGRTWEQMEGTPYTLPDWNHVKTLIAKFGSGDALKKFEALECVKLDRYKYERKQEERHRKVATA